MRMYQFKALIDKYNAPFTLKTQSGGGYDDNGMWQDGAIVTTQEQGAIVPFSNRAIYQSGGQLTTADRKLYSLKEFGIGSTIVYRNRTYTVESGTDWTEYGDFYSYTMKAVSNDASIK